MTFLPKDKNYLGPALKQYSPNNRHEKLKGLCKTGWVERHSCLETFGELYEHVVTWFDVMVNPDVYPEVNESRWNWDSDMTSKLWLMVLKVTCKVLELLLASQYGRIVWIIWKVCQLNYKEDILWGIYNDWQYQIRDSLF